MAACIPDDGVHVVIDCPKGSDFQKIRFETAKSIGGIVAFVDDDDTVFGEGMRHCALAMKENPTLGLAFTDQCRIDALGGHMPAELTRARSTYDLAMHPQMAHHLAVINMNCVSDGVLLLAEEIGIGVEWLMRTNAGLRHGVVHIPLVSYGWRYHSKQESATKEWSLKYEAAMDSLRAVNKAWMGHSRSIKQFKVEQA